MNLTLATTLAIAGLLTSPFLAAAQQQEPTTPKRQLGLVHESEVGLSFFVPKLLNVTDLLRYAGEMTENTFMVELADGNVDKRYRFINMSDAIGIQGTEAKRAKLVAILENLDARVGEVRAAANDHDGIHALRTMRLKCMSIDSAMKLVDELSLPISIAAVKETGNLVLRGPRGTLEEVEKILAEADRPLPQLTMHCEILEAVTPDTSGRQPAHRLYKQPPTILEGDVAKALETINPGKKFARRAHMLLRSSVGGQEPIEISSAIAKSFADEGDSPNKPRLVFSCIPSAWDPESKTLTLGDCSVILEVPNYQILATGNGNETVRQFTGYTQQGISSRLSLKAGETTVIGSLGGDPVYVALRFTVR